ncbi:MAG: GntR family transcriptional regulator [Victivallaceae bacterium]|nr:GntR family transcriptional regulator [Victivallaceae bacterium]
MNLVIERLSSEPLYLQVKESLKQYIIEKNLVHGSRLPSISKIAASANIGLETAQKALNELVKEGICYSRPKRGTFVGIPTVVKKKDICLFYHYDKDEAIENHVSELRIFKGLRSRAHELNIDISLIVKEPEETIAFYLTRKEFNVTGVFIFSRTDLDEGKKLAIKFPNIRFVYLAYYLQGIETMPPNVYGVFDDDFAGGYQMTQYLIEQGHKNIIAFNIDIDYCGYRRRISGYEQAMKDNKLPLDPQMEITVDRSDDISLQDLGRQTCAELLEQKCKHPEAIFCVNDIFAAGVVEYLQEHDLDKEITVTGYDYVIPVYSRSHNFSTMAVNYDKFGPIGFDFLISKTPPQMKIVKLLPQLIPKGECKLERHLQATV